MKLSKLEKNGKHQDSWTVGLSLFWPMTILDLRLGQKLKKRKQFIFNKGYQEKYRVLLKGSFPPKPKNVCVLEAN